MSRGLYISIVALFVCGCSNYPLPQDSTGSTTSDIVANIRCEARAAVQEEAIQYLEKFDKTPVYLHSISGQELARQLRNHEKSMNQQLYDGLDSALHEKLDYYGHTQLALDFTLTGNEMNRQGVDLNLTKGILSPVDTLNLAGTATRVRQVDRNFVTIDTLKFLALKISDDYCARAAKNVNIVYPMAGRLPVSELVKSYIDINDLGTLHNRDDVGKPTGTSSDVATPTMSDTIAFTTTLESRIDPTLNYNPLAKVFTLTSLGVTNDNTRMDKHQVIATLVTAPVDAKTKKAPPKEKLRGLSTDAVNNQRAKLVQDAIISIGAALSQPGSGLSSLLR